MTEGLFRRINHGSTADEAVRQIEFLLLDGVLSSGDRLPAERELSEQLDISRPVLRDALKQLETRGLIVSRHGGGTYVADLIGQVFSKPVAELVARHVRATRDYLEYRRELEGYAASLAAKRATAADKARLAAIVAELQRATAASNFQGEIDGDIELHNAIGEAAHNIILMHTLRACYKLLAEGIFFNKQMVLDLPGSRDQLLAQHEAIVAAIIDGNSDAARRASEAHIDYVAEAVDEARRADQRIQVSHLRGMQRQSSRAGSSDRTSARNKRS